MAWEVKTINVADLLLDLENPRLELQNSQIEAISEMIRSQSEKIVKLTQDIVDFGVNPSELPIVIKGNDGKYVVVEGNRRLVALKVLHNPNLVEGILNKANIQRIKTLSASFEKTPIDSINCTVCETREEADHWIELRHTGQNQGAGIVTWGAIEIAYFMARRGEDSPLLKIIEMAHANANFIKPKADSQNKIPITTLERIIFDPYVKELIGYDIIENNLIIKKSNDRVSHGITKIVEDLAHSRINVNTVRHKVDRKKYIDSIMSSFVPESGQEDSRAGGNKDEKPKEEAGSGISGSGEKNSTSGRKSNRKSNPASTKREFVIPRDCILEISHPRINNIYLELKKLSIDSFLNCAGVMLRVFLELTLDNYIKENNVGIDERSKLHIKIKKVSDHLESSGKMSESELLPLRKAGSEDQWLASKHTMNGYIHNYHLSPTPKDVKVIWDNLQLFFERVWTK